MIRTQEQHLAHYGILRRSGRYPWGSGSTENTRNKSFLHIVDEQRKQGLSETEIAKFHGITTTQLRAARHVALAQQKQQKILTAQRLKEKGWSNGEIAKRMGLPGESSVRALLAPGEKEKADATSTTANMIKKQVDKKKYVDIGSGVEAQLGITQSRLSNSVAVLREQGYEVHNIKVLQVGTGKYTTTKVLAVPGTSLSEVQRNRSQIRLITDYSVDHGRSFLSTQPPISIKSRRIAVNYADDGGSKADGVIYVRPGVKDLSIGSGRYSQVRIAVDGTHYLKGMAVYKDDLPDGVDLVFNTNKKNTGNKKDVMKPLEKDKDGNISQELPFGAIIRQIHGPTGKVTSAMNLVGSPTKEGSGEEGQWDTWSRNLPSQFLSKQSTDLAKQQLDLTYERRIKEFDEISSLTNPTVKKELLLKFADSSDSASVHLKAASLPRQATRVILPIPSMKEDEIYVPSMRDGERVALVRFPHGGTFEIPQLTVNNRNREARKTIGTGIKVDAVGINHKTAERLSGADFDGDTVLVIPNNKGSVKSTPALEGLKGFDPQTYKIPEGSPIPKITSQRKGYEMGRISNLITDMTIRGASTEERARAVRHSMVVIDSEKHGLDYRLSEKDHGIANLREKYQITGTGSKKGGASTLISLAGAETRINERKARRASAGGPIDPATGKKVFEETGRSFPVLKRDPATGKKVPTGATRRATDTFDRLAVTDNAFDLSSGTHVEAIYAEHSNRLKALANTARKEAVRTKSAPYNKSAKAVYSNEVASLNAKLNIAKKNAPLERQAQLLANVTVSQKRQSNPNMPKEEVTKLKQVAQHDARIRTGAQKQRIVMTQQEWNAIQAGAISTNKLEEILRHSDAETVKQLALPRHSTKLTSTMLTRAHSMLASGYTQAEVADQLGIGLTTLKVGLSG